MSNFDQATMVLIEEHVRRLLGALGFGEAKVHCRYTALQTEPEAHAQLHIQIEAGDAGKLLIGIQGNHLEALQHIVRVVLRRQLTAPLHIAVDVNGYRQRREQGLLQLAESTAQRAQQTGRTIVLRPMTAADRRILHTALAARGDVKTESMGDEPNRRVVVRPIFL